MNSRIVALLFAVAFSTFALSASSQIVERSSYDSTTQVVAGTGAPSTGTWTKGAVVMDAAGDLFKCTAAGSPGTWSAVGGGGGSAVPGEALLFYQPDQYTASGSRIGVLYFTLEPEERIADGYASVFYSALMYSNNNSVEGNKACQFDFDKYATSGSADADDTVVVSINFADVYDGSADYHYVTGSVSLSLFDDGAVETTEHWRLMWVHPGATGNCYMRAVKFWLE